MRLKEAIDRAKEVNRVISHRSSQAVYYQENREVIQEKRRSLRGNGYGG